MFVLSRQDCSANPLVRCAPKAPPARQVRQNGADGGRLWKASFRRLSRVTCWLQNSDGFLKSHQSCARWRLQKVPFRHLSGLCKEWVKCVCGSVARGSPPRVTRCSGTVSGCLVRHPPFKRAFAAFGPPSCRPPQKLGWAAAERADHGLAEPRAILHWFHGSFQNNEHLGSSLV